MREVVPHLVSAKVQDFESLQVTLNLEHVT